MEGVAAFSLACNVIQIAELSRKIIATTKEIQTSRNGLPKDHEDIRTAVEILRRDVADLQQNHNGDTIQRLAVQSEVAINEHIALLDSLRLKGPRTFLHASAAAFKARRKQRQLYESQAKVDRLSEELKAHIVMTRIPNIDRNVDHLGDKIASHNFSIDHDMKIIEQHLSRVRKVTENNSNTANATAELVVELQRWLKDQQDSQANRQCLHALYFSELRSRADQVKRAHEDTFGWIFDGAGDLFGSVHRNKFKNWLRLDDPNRNVFWVYGKPGAGKSTLIKFITTHPDLRLHCQSWLGSRSLLVIDCYLWRQGTILQRSLRGLLQSILYQALKECPQLIPKAFPRREWTHAGTDFQFPQDVLWNGFQDLLNLAPSFNIFMLFIIDGLDEFDDRAEIRKNSAPDVQDLLRLLRAIQASPSAKLCVASRPLNEFEIHLGKDGDFCIPIHDLTSRDIKAYTEDTLRKHPAFAQLVSQDSGYATLITSITSAAEGVFLWVYLACNSLLNGLTNADRVSDLQGRLMRLPHELDEMYMHILSTIEPEYRRNTARSLLLCTMPEQETLLTHHYLDDESRKQMLDAPSLQQFMNGEDVVLFAATVRRRFNARTRGLLEFRASRRGYQIDEFRGVQHEISELGLECVGLAHRSMAELLDRNDMKHQIMAEAGMAFEMPELYAQASMAALKAEASIAWTLGSTQDSGYHFGKKDPNDAEKNLCTLLYNLVRIMEQTEEEQMKAHWSKLDDLLNFPFTQEMKLKDIIMGIVSKEFYPDTFAVGLAFCAPKYVSLMLRHDPTLITTRSKAWPPLLVSLLWNFSTKSWSVRRHYDMMKILLEHGADPNEPFQGTTPWMCYVENVLYSSLSNPGSSRLPILYLLVQYGANIHITWDWLGCPLKERTWKDKCVIPSFTVAGTGYQQKIPDAVTASFQLSAAAVLYHVLTGDGSSAKKTNVPVPVPEWLPSVPEQEQVEVVLKGQGIYNFLGR